jgi:hypothetical protein
VALAAWGVATKGWRHRLHSPGRKGWATIVQLIGAIVTAIGLGLAWLRAKYRTNFVGLLKLLREWIRRLTCGPGSVDVAPESTATTMTGGFALVYKNYCINKNLTTKENLQKLADLVDEYIPNVEKDLTALRTSVGSLRSGDHRVRYCAGLRDITGRKDLRRK